MSAARFESGASTVFTIREKAAIVPAQRAHPAKWRSHSERSSRGSERSQYAAIIDASGH
jgi:hypothetical protein